MAASVISIQSPPEADLEVGVLYPGPRRDGHFFHLSVSFPVCKTELRISLFSHARVVKLSSRITVVDELCKLRGSYKCERLEMFFSKSAEYFQRLSFRGLISDRGKIVFAVDLVLDSYVFLC